MGSKWTTTNGRISWNLLYLMPFIGLVHIFIFSSLFLCDCATINIDTNHINPFTNTTGDNIETGSTITTENAISPEILDETKTALLPTTKIPSTKQLSTTKTINTIQSNLESRIVNLPEVNGTTLMAPVSSTILTTLYENATIQNENNETATNNPSSNVTNQLENSNQSMDDDVTTTTFLSIIVNLNGTELNNNNAFTTHPSPIHHENLDTIDDVTNRPHNAIDDEYFIGQTTNDYYQKLLAQRTSKSHHFDDDKEIDQTVQPLNATDAFTDFDQILLTTPITPFFDEKHKHYQPHDLKFNNNKNNSDTHNRHGTEMIPQYLHIDLDVIKDNGTNEHRSWIYYNNTEINSTRYDVAIDEVRNSHDGNIVTNNINNNTNSNNSSNVEKRGKYLQTINHNGGGNEAGYGGDVNLTIPGTVDVWALASMKNFEHNKTKERTFYNSTLSSMIKKQFPANGANDTTIAVSKQLTDWVMVMNNDVFTNHSTFNKEYNHDIKDITLNDTAKDFKNLNKNITADIVAAAATIVHDTTASGENKISPFNNETPEIRPPMPIDNQKAHAHLTNTNLDLNYSTVTVVENKIDLPKPNEIDILDFNKQSSNIGDDADILAINNKIKKGGFIGNATKYEVSSKIPPPAITTTATVPLTLSNDGKNDSVVDGLNVIKKVVPLNEVFNTIHTTPQPSTDYTIILQQPIETENPIATITTEKPIEFLTIITTNQPNEISTTLPKDETTQITTIPTMTPTIFGLTTKLTTIVPMTTDLIPTTFHETTEIPVSQLPELTTQFFERTSTKPNELITTISHSPTQTTISPQSFLTELNDGNKNNTTNSNQIPNEIDFPSTTNDTVERRKIEDNSIGRNISDSENNKTILPNENNTAAENSTHLNEFKFSTNSILNITENPSQYETTTNVPEINVHKHHQQHHYPIIGDDNLYEPPEAGGSGDLTDIGPLNDNGETDGIQSGQMDVNAIIATAVSIVGIICLILLVGFLVVMRKRQKQLTYGQRCRPVGLDAYSLDNVSVYNSVRRKGMLRASKRSFGNAAFDDPTLRNNLLTMHGLATFVQDKQAIYEEFKELPTVIARADEVPSGCEAKNRYANVVPLPETRVYLKRLNDDEQSEYINANYVKVPKDPANYYIACQAPLDSTITDFWRMIWEQNSSVVLMLTDLIESGIEKCAEYLPPSVVLDNHVVFGDFTITLRGREVKDKYAVSTIHLRNASTKTWREITHFWYQWPNIGVPSNEATIVAMLLEARSYQKMSIAEQPDEIMDKLNNQQIEHHQYYENGSIDKTRSLPRVHGPITVHCSPGTGRTGTVIACDIAIRTVEQPSRSVDIPQIVYYVRRGRASSVQTREQYEFIYKVAHIYATKLIGPLTEN